MACAHAHTEPSHDVHARDINGDTHLDVAIVKMAWTGVASNLLFLNDGAASFTLDSGFPAFASQSSVAVAFGDVDGDDDLDVLFANDGTKGGTVGVYLYQNDGYGVLTESLSFAALGLGDNWDW